MRLLSHIEGIEKTVLAMTVVLCCGLLDGCDSRAEKKVENVAVGHEEPPPEPPPEPPYSPRPKGTLSFSADIAPIVFQKCASCHRPGEIGPFSLLSYADVRKRARQIVDVTRSRFMPPWAAVRGYCLFEQDRSLTTDDIGKISQWADEGAAEGSPSSLPPLPKFTSGWKFGKPDLVLHMSEPYTMPATVTDTLRKFVIRVPVKERKYVKGWDFDPGNSKIVHHAFLYLDQSGWSRYYDEMDPLPGFDGALGGTARGPDGFNLAWNPGRSPAPPDDRVSWRLEPGTDLVIELHLCGTGKAETVQPSVALYFAPKPPTIHPGIVALWADTIDIPPGEKAYVVRDRYVLPVDAVLLSVGPHAHYRGKDFQVWAVLPDGSESWLLRIKDWDFNWQNTYTYAESLRLPKGTALCMKITYDNSAENPRNPTIPPKRVRIGRYSSDEMGEIVFDLRLENEREAARLQQDYQRRFFKKSMQRDLFLARCEPTNADAQYNLGVEFQALGQWKRAAQHYEASVRINPNNAYVRNNLGSVYRELGRTSDAIAEYAAAIRIYPHDAKARNNLGYVYLLEGDLERAAPEFEEALKIKKDFVEAECNLGMVAIKKKDLSKAAAHFEQALKFNPDYRRAREALLSLRAEAPSSMGKPRTAR